MSSTELHSIVVPMYNESQVAEEFIRRATAALSSLPDYEIIVIDDGSNDDTFADRLGARRQGPAPQAGSLRPQLRPPDRDDRRHRPSGRRHRDRHRRRPPGPPGTHPTDGRAVARRRRHRLRGPRVARRRERLQEGHGGGVLPAAAHEPPSVDIPLDTADFRLMSRKATEGLKAMRERSRYMRGLVGWMGLNRASITYHRDPQVRRRQPSTRCTRCFAWRPTASCRSRPARSSSRRCLGLASAALGFLVALGRHPHQAHRRLRRSRLDVHDRGGALRRRGAAGHARRDRRLHRPRLRRGPQPAALPDRRRPEASTTRPPSTSPTRRCRALKNPS